jgi:hypothetical protein
MKLRKKRKTLEKAEYTFNRIMDLVRDLEPKDYRKIKNAMDQAYKAYQIVRGVVEDDIDTAEHELNKLTKEVK